MAVIARHRAAILALAEKQPQTDPTFRRLLDHGNLRSAYCLWGLMPGSILDEQSAFNGCSHAYLAAAKALLIHMKTMAAAQQPAEALISAIDAELVQSGSSWVLCQYSADTFSTGAIVEPRWRDLVFHGPSLLALVLPAIRLLAMTAFVFGAAAVGRAAVVVSLRGRRPRSGAALRSAALLLLLPLLVGAAWPEWLASLALRLDVFGDTICASRDVSVRDRDPLAIATGHVRPHVSAALRCGMMPWFRAVPVVTSHARRWPTHPPGGRASSLQWSGTSFAGKPHGRRRSERSRLPGRSFPNHIRNEPPRADLYSATMAASFSETLIRHVGDQLGTKRTCPNQRELIPMIKLIRAAALAALSSAALCGSAFAHAGSSPPSRRPMPPSTLLPRRST